MSRNVSLVPSIPAWVVAGIKDLNRVIVDCVATLVLRGDIAESSSM